MNELINKVYQNKLADGTIEAVISKEIEVLIKKCCEDLFSYNGPIKNAMKEKINEAMGNVVERSDFSHYVVKMTELINQVLPETALPDYKKMVDNIASIAGAKMEFCPKVKLSEIFDKYCAMIKDGSYTDTDVEDSDNIYNDEGDKTYNITCSYEHEDDYLEFNTEGFDLDNQTKYNFRFKVHRWSNGTIALSNSNKYSLSDLSSLNSFEVYMLLLKQQFAEITIDDENQECDVEITIED